MSLTATLAATFRTTAIGAAAIVGVAALELDPKLKAYEPTTGITGTLISVGSDTLNNLMTAWAEDFRARYPSVRPEIEGKGSTTAPPALIAGTAQFGPMSRAMKQEEINAFEAQFGYKPFELKVAIDGLCVFVHKDNPLTELTLTQVDSIFSSTYKFGGKPATAWEAVGVSAWAGKPIATYGRNSASGTYGYFKEVALKKGDFKTTVKEQAGSSAVVTAVAGDPLGIGYSGIGYMTGGVKALALAPADGGAAVAPTYENCLSGDYPLARFLYVYINKAPGKPLDPMVKEFVKFMLSRDGQDDVGKDGYFPLTAEIVAEQLAALEQ
ncbi:MAG: hypothetical protein RLZZ127_1592 [Planctomycetota bacterium]|jgi:phosphate transport system substrate-binding protein